MGAHASGSTRQAWFAVDRRDWLAFDRSDYLAVTVVLGITVIGPVLLGLGRFVAGRRPGDPGYPRKVFLVHGDPEAQIALEPKVRDLGLATHIPHWHERVTLD